MKISTKWLLAIGAVACAVLLAGRTVLADCAYDMESSVSSANTGQLTFDGGVTGTSDGGVNQAVVTALAGVPTTLAGRTYSTYIWFAADASGSLDIFDNSATHMTSGFAVGDVISVTGLYSPFHDIPELEAPYTAVNVTGTGALPTPGGVTPQLTIPQITAAPFDVPLLGPMSEGGSGIYNSSVGEGDPDVTGYYLEIPNVWIGGGGANWKVYPQGGNVAYTITDQSGNTMTMYYYITSYERCAMLMSNSVGVGTVDIYGFCDSFITTTKSGSVISTNFGDEIVPLLIVQVPEPSSFMLAGVGLLSVLAVIRRRRS